MGPPFFFQTQDSYFYLRTALRFAFIPFLVFVFAGQATYLVLRMNYSFFVVNGFEQELSTFFDVIFSNTSSYAFSIMSYLIVSFLAGLYLSYISLKPFDEIEDCAYKILETNQLDSSFLHKKKSRLIYKSATLLFEYIFSLSSDYKKTKTRYSL